MNAVIWKYEVPNHGDFELEVPERAFYRKFGIQDGKLVLWVEVNPDAPGEITKFKSIWTGESFKKEEIDKDKTVMIYLGTKQIESIVTHLYRIVVIK